MRPHVVVEAGEAGGEQHVLLRVHREIVAIAVAAVGARHRLRVDELALVRVERHAGLAALVFRIGERLHQHAPGERVIRVRAEEARLVAEVAHRAHELGLRRVAGNVEHPDAVLRQAAGPDMPPIVGEAHVVRLGARAGRHGVDYLAVGLGLRVDVHGDELVGAVAKPLHAEGPDVDVVLLAFDQLRDVRRVAGLVGRGGGDSGQPGRDQPREQDTDPHPAMNSHESLPVQRVISST